MNTSRRQSRELAMQILFQSEFTTPISIHSFLQIYENSYSNETISYADQLIKGVTEFKNKIDDKISSVSRNWRVDRMAIVDRNILRIAIFEMKIANEKLSEKIVINEAVEIAKKYSNMDSGAFINGLLDQINREEWH